MMVYFNKFPNINYDFKGASASGSPQRFPNVEMLDVFRRVVFTDETLRNSANFEDYLVREGQKPDDVSDDFYGSPDFWWLVLLSNNIIDVENEWPKAVSEIDNLFSGFLTGNTYYLFENLDVRQGDIIVKRDLISVTDGGGGTAGIDIDKYGVVDSYDPFLRKINVKVGSGALNKGDEVHIYRKSFGGDYNLVGGFGETGCYQPFFASTTCVGISGPESNATHTHWGSLCATQGATFGIIQRKDSIRGSVKDFRVQGDSANPYSSYISGIDGQPDGPSGDFFSYQSLCGMTGTILYNYITDTLNSNVNVLTVGDDILNINDRNRTIKLLSPMMIGNLVVELDSLIRGDVPRGTTRIIEMR